MSPVETSTGFRAAILAVVLFLVLFGYDVLFEVFASGRTPGKRITGLRVVRTGGEPVGFLTSSIRNLMRLVDILPSFYVVGGISVLASSRNQRLGDMAAGTLVVRERRGDAKLARLQALPTPAYDSVPWDVSGVTAEELAIVRSFLHRRQTLDDGARSDLARELAARLRPRVTGAFDELGDEVFLQRLAAAKAARV